MSLGVGSGKFENLVVSECYNEHVYFPVLLRFIFFCIMLTGLEPTSTNDVTVFVCEVYIM